MRVTSILTLAVIAVSSVFARTIKPVAPQYEGLLNEFVDATRQAAVSDNLFDGKSITFDEMQDEEFQDAVAQEITARAIESRFNSDESRQALIQAFSDDSFRDALEVQLAATFADIFSYVDGEKVVDDDTLAEMLEAEFANQPETEAVEAAVPAEGSAAGLTEEDAFEEEEFVPASEELSEDELAELAEDDEAVEDDEAAEDELDEEDLAEDDEYAEDDEVVEDDEAMEDDEAVEDDEAFEEDDVVEDDAALEEDDVAEEDSVDEDSA